MSGRPPPRAVENYTVPFLVTLGMLLFIALMTISAVAGFVWAAACALVLDRLIALVARL